MKLLPKLPYLQNIVQEYHRQHQPLDGLWGFDSSYREWLRQFGFAVPVMGDWLEFPDDFREEKLLLFTIRFG